MLHPLSRRGLLETGGISAAATLAGCKKSPGPVTLTLGDQKGGMQSLLARSGQLANLDYKIVWAQFGAAAPLFEALNANAVDAGIGGDAPFVFFLASAPAAQAIAALTFRGTPSPNIGGILVRPDSPINTIQDLAGKRVAVVRGSTGQYVTLAALKTAGMKLDAVNFTILDPSDSLSTLLSGGVDAWGSWEPYMSLGELHYGLRRLDLNVRQLDGVGFIVATSTAITNKQAALRDFLGRFGQARAWAATNPDLFAAGFSKDTGLPLDVAQRYAVEMNYQLVPIDQGAIATVQALADLYAEAKLLPQPLNVSGGFDDGFLTES